VKFVTDCPPMLDQFHPTIGEVSTAFEVFCRELNRWAVDVQRPEGDPLRTSPEHAIKLAAAKVWREARRFQWDKMMHSIAVGEVGPRAS